MENENNPEEFRTDSATTDPGESGDARPGELGPYAAAIAAYLEGADWLNPILDAPLIVHARSIATSLDKQLAAKGEIQSALAGSFDKALFRLDARRPRPPAGPGVPTDDPHQSTVFDFLSD